MTAVSDVFNRAVQYHQAGDLGSAERVYHEILRLDPKHPDTLHLLGVAAHQRSRNEEAVKYIRQAIALKQNDAVYYFNLGNAYHKLGRAGEAAASHKQALELKPHFPQAHFALANALIAQGRRDEAETHFRRAIDQKPDYPEAFYNLGNLYCSAAKPDAAIDAYQRALELRPGYFVVYTNLARAYEEQERLDEAIALYDDALEHHPENLQTLNNLGRLLKLQNRLSEAEHYYREAIRVSPDSPAAHSNLGTVLQRMRRYGEAEEAYWHALEIDRDAAKRDPQLCNTYGNLGSLYESQNRLDEAESMARRGAEIAPDHTHCQLIVAKCETRKKEYRSAVERLRNLSLSEASPSLVRDVHFELGYLYDRLGESDDAFRHFAEANRWAARMFRAHGADATRYSQEIEVLHRFLSKCNPDAWSPVPPLESEPSPVFLVGFPRSGTTLLDQILDSHPRLQTLEEKPTILTAKKRMAEFPDGYPQSLVRLAPEQAQELRSVFFEVADEWIDRNPQQILIDKLPLNTINVAFIRRLFPEARFIVAIRHPCDVCLSCFMQNFESNDAMANFLSLEETASLYARVMGLWQRSCQVVPHPYHIIRYEDLVADLPGEVARLLEFLDVEWDDSVLDHTQHARSRGPINTPSYRQVTQPIYKRARYRWKRYADHMAPVMDRLQPFIEFFGYDADTTPETDEATHAGQ